VGESDLQVGVYPALDLKTAIVGGVEADAVRILILSRPAYRGAHLHAPAVQDGQRKIDLYRVSDVELGGADERHPAGAHFESRRRDPLVLRLDGRFRNDGHTYVAAQLVDDQQMSGADNFED